jgi:thiol-disulfide isomerase/thioredoxin
MRRSPGLRDRQKACRLTLKRRNAVAIGFAALLAAAGAVFYRSLVPPESPTGSLAFLSSAKTLPIYDRQGRVTDLAREKGRFLIVHFWATWCPPCVEEIPELSRFWDRYRNRADLVLYTVSEDKDWKIIDDFSRKNPNQLPMYRDPDSATAARFGSTQYPETYIINSSGRVIYRVQGGLEWTDSSVQQRIDQLLSGS